MPDDSAVSDGRQIDNMRRQFLRLAGVSIGMSGLAGCGGDGDGDGDGGGGGSDSGAAKPNVIHIEASKRTVEVS